MARPIAFISLMAFAIAPLHAFELGTQNLAQSKLQMLTRALLAPLIIKHGSSTLSDEQRLYYIEHALAQGIPPTLNHPCSITFDHNASTWSRSLVETCVIEMQPEVLELLLRHDAHIDTHEPETHLHRAIYWALSAKRFTPALVPSAKRIISMLIEHGANPHIPG